MSTTKEKIEAQRMVFKRVILHPLSKHLIGPVELEQLFEYKEAYEKLRHHLANEKRREYFERNSIRAG